MCALCTVWAYAVSFNSHNSAKSCNQQSPTASAERSEAYGNFVPAQVIQVPRWERMQTQGMAFYQQRDIIQNSGGPNPPPFPPQPVSPVVQR